MLKAITAIDDLKNPGDRILVLEDENKELTIVAFPDDRGTLVYEDKLYDWYGREVEIDPRIKRIVRPFGYSIDQPHNTSNYRDNFIVELTNGNCAVVGIHYRYPEPKNPNYTGSRCLATGYILEASPYLHLNDAVVTYESIKDDIIKDTFLDNLRYDTEYPLDAIGQLPNSSQCVFLSSHVRHFTSSNGFFIHHIVPSKEALVDFFTGPGQKSKKATHPPTIHTQTTLFDDFIISEDGRKITANFSYAPNPSIRASLDSECLKFRNGYHLYWYKEHEP